MQLSELTARAKGRVSSLARPTDVDGERDRLRAEVASFLEHASEPPVYRRRDDPLKQQTAAQLRDGETLLSRLLQLENERLIVWREALEAYLLSQCLVSEGKLEQAEDAWFKALELERRAAKERRVWSRTDEKPPAVFERVSGQSRFDPRPEPAMQGKLMCPSCRTVADFGLSLRHAMHHFICAACQTPFTAYVGELRSLEQRNVGGSRKRYVARIEELSGGHTRIDFEDSSGGAFTAARRDVLAFLYSPRPILRCVLNLSSSRALWLQSGGFCFLATAVFDEGAVELQTFRRVRDQRLLPTRAGRLVVRAYYAAGPTLAQVVRRVPVLARLTRRALTGIHTVVTRSGV